MDEAYTYHTVRYVLRNPVCAGIVRFPWRYEWSSATFHVADSDWNLLLLEVRDILWIEEL